LALVLAFGLFGAGYVAGSVAPLPWLRPVLAAEVALVQPTSSATAPPTLTPEPTATATPLPTGTPTPTETPFPTPTERAVTPQATRAVTLPPATEAQVDTAFAAFREAWDMIHADYLNRPIDDVKLVRGAIRGMVRTLEDPYSGYNDPEEFRRLNDDLSGQFEGIGVEVAEKDGRIVIIAPISGSPAEKAGLRPGDIILRVDDRSVLGLNTAEVGGMVRGPAGTSVKLTIQRPNAPETLDVSITRARIVTKNVEALDLPAYARDQGLMYVKLANFGQRSAADMRETLRLMMAPSPKGLILDLRGNPGGSLFAAIDITSQFIADGVVMLEDDADGKRQTFTARPGGLATKVPLVVLIDKGSASASEIVAGAIKDRGRGTLIGETTFGKGTVQEWHQLANDQGGLRLTIARWLTPRGTWVHGQGVAPDIQVARTADDRAAGRDPQLDRAIQHLLSVVR
jgi:carboxyl-terminal processing protease